MTRSPSPGIGIGRLLVFGLVAATLVAAHAHHDAEDVGPYEHNFTNEEPLDHVIKWHIAIQIACWGILFPIGMVLGITRSRFHVPWQLVAIALSLAGNYLGHHHHGRGFHMTAHAHFATYLWWYLMLQLAFGVFLKLHVLEGTALRRGVVTAHGILGKTFPLVGWVQMIFGGIAALGFCFGDHFGQCLAHFIMGSAFIGYAMILLIMLRVGAGFLARKRVSQEYLDSWVIMLWGIVNTFTEHNFLAAHPTGWSHKDMQHVSLGVLWWAGGALGIFLGRKSTRNVVPAVIIGMTGYAMANHGQHLEFSTDVHKLFGWSLMSAGFARIIEVCFVLRDSASDNVRPRAFQHLPPYLLVLSGLTFLSATEEQMQWIAGSGMDSTTYANILFSGAFAIYLVGNALLELYMVQAQAGGKSPPRRQHGAIGLAAAAASEEEEDDDDDDRAGLGDDDEDVENAAGAGGPRRYRPAAGTSRSSSSSPIIKRLAHAVPAALAGLVGSVASVVRSLDNAAPSSSSSSSSSSVAGNREMAEYYESLPLTNRDSADHHMVQQQHDHDGHSILSSSARRAAAQQYSHMNGNNEATTTSSHAASAGRIANGRRADQQAGPAGASDATVFDIGDFGEDDDDGGDGYWQDDDDDKGVLDDSNGTARDDEGEQVAGRARSSRHVPASAAASSINAQGVHRTARVT